MFPISTDDNSNRRYYLCRVVTSSIKPTKSNNRKITGEDIRLLFWMNGRWYNDYRGLGEFNSENVLDFMEIPDYLQPHNEKRILDDRESIMRCIDGYRIYSDSYLNGMTKDDLISQLRCAESHIISSSDAISNMQESLKDWQPVVTSKWIGTRGAYDDTIYWNCGHCDSQECTGESRMYLPKYCPNCGAKMVEVEIEEDDDD